MVLFLTILSPATIPSVIELTGTKAGEG
jgi:hypothetical protein